MHTEAIFQNKSRKKCTEIRPVINSKKEDYYSVIADLINRLVQQDEINEECLEINFFFRISYNKRWKISLKSLRKFSQKSKSEYKLAHDTIPWQC